MVKIERVPVEWVERKIQNLCAIFLRFLPWLSPTVYTALYFFICCPLDYALIFCFQFFAPEYGPVKMYACLKLQHLAQSLLAERPV